MKTLTTFATAALFVLASAGALAATPQPTAAPAAPAATPAVTPHNHAAERTGPTVTKKADGHKATPAKPLHDHRTFHK